MRFAQRVFLVAGIYGLLLMPLMYFQERQFGRDYPPLITHPEFYYGFVGVVLAWQIAFLVIAYDPRRFRPLMIPAMLEKFLFVLAIGGLLLAGRRDELARFIPFAALIDLVLGVLFVIAWRKTGDEW